MSREVLFTSQLDPCYGSENGTRGKRIDEKIKILWKEVLDSNCMQMPGS